MILTNKKKQTKGKYFLYEKHDTETKTREKKKTKHCEPLLTAACSVYALIYLRLLGTFAEADKKCLGVSP